MKKYFFVFFTFVFFICTSNIFGIFSLKKDYNTLDGVVLTEENFLKECNRFLLL